MRRVRTILTILLLASALCADRAIAAAPEIRPQISNVTRQVVVRLSKRFREVLPVAKLVETRVVGGYEGVRVERMVEGVVGLHDRQSMPFEFRLPPPGV